MAGGAAGTLVPIIRCVLWLSLRAHLITHPGSGAVPSSHRNVLLWDDYLLPPANGSVVLPSSQSTDIYITGALSINAYVAVV